MAKFKAATRIQYGEEKGNGEGVELQTFEPGTVVTGLPNEIMKDLWDSGSLVKVDEDSKDEKEDSKDGGDK